MGDLMDSLIGVEEEFHLVDLQTRAAVPVVDAVLARLHGDSFAPELQRSPVEANTVPCESLDELRAELCRLRRRLNEVADPLGLGVVATGTVPLVDLLGTDISAGARYERMQHEYQLLVREQHICGVQVHVDVPDWDVAVAVVQHLALHLPTFLALSASSPYWRGTDSGYASYRCLVWQRWPTAGPPGAMRSAADYDAMVADLVASGTISDPGMVYFDIRPSAHLPTVELRICDACPAVDDVVLIAGLFRALVTRARSWVEEGRPFPRPATSCCGPRAGGPPGPGWRVTSSTSPTRPDRPWCRRRCSSNGWSARCGRSWRHPATGSRCSSCRSGHLPPAAPRPASAGCSAVAASSPTSWTACWRRPVASRCTASRR